MNKLKTVSKVLQIKSYKKEELEREVKKIRDIMDLEQARLNSLERTFAETIVRFDEKQKEMTLNIDELGLFYNYLLKLYEKMDVQKMVIKQRRAELNERQDDLFKAYKEKKLFEIMKEKIVHEDIRGRAVSEQREIDYMFLSRKRRNK